MWPIFRWYLLAVCFREGSLCVFFQKNNHMNRTSELDPRCLVFSKFKIGSEVITWHQLSDHEKPPRLVGFFLGLYLPSFCRIPLKPSSFSWKVTRIATTPCWSKPSKRCTVQNDNTFWEGIEINPPLKWYGNICKKWYIWCKYVWPKKPPPQRRWARLLWPRGNV